MSTGRLKLLFLTANLAVALVCWATPPRAVAAESKEAILAEAYCSSFAHLSPAEFADRAASLFAEGDYGDDDRVLPRRTSELRVVLFGFREGRAGAKVPKELDYMQNLKDLVSTIQTTTGLRIVLRIGTNSDFLLNRWDRGVRPGDLWIHYEVSTLARSWVITWSRGDVRFDQLNQAIEEKANERLVNGMSDNNPGWCIGGVKTNSLLLQMYYGTIVSIPSDQMGLCMQEFLLRGIGIRKANDTDSLDIDGLKLDTDRESLGIIVSALLYEDQSPISVGGLHEAASRFASKQRPFCK